MKTNQPRAPSQFEVFWKRWWTHFQVNVTEAWSSRHKVKLCHVAEIHCCRIWYIFYMIFVRVFFKVDLFLHSMLLPEYLKLEIRSHSHMSRHGLKYAEHDGGFTFKRTWPEHNLIILQSRDREITTSSTKTGYQIPWLFWPSDNLLFAILHISSYPIMQGFGYRLLKGYGMPHCIPEGEWWLTTGSGGSYIKRFFSSTALYVWWNEWKRTFIHACSSIDKMSC
jgi:hypothetical protein